MGFGSQFDNFDPMSGDISFGALSDEAINITNRARAVLWGRKSNDVHNLASTASEGIDSYFEIEKDEAVSRLVQENDEEFIEFDYDEDGSNWRLRPEKEDDLEIATSENTSEQEALKLCLDSWGELNGSGVTDPKPHDYFAAMALWHIGDYIRRRSRRHDYVNGKFGEFEIESLNTNDYQNISGLLFKALDSVCYAERLKSEFQMEFRFQEKISRMESERNLAHEQAIAEIRLKAAEDAKEDDARRRSLRAKELGHISHRKTYEARDLVLLDWEKNKSDFNSAEKAGLHYANWISAKNKDDKDKKAYEPRTVTTWIRTYAKQKGIRLR